MQSATRRSTPELALPTASLLAIRQALTEEVGPDAAARALQRAGFAAGEALFPLLGDRPGPGAGANSAAAHPPSELPETLFWRRLSELFASRGWGHLRYEPVHPGVGALVATDWVEASPAADAARPSCHFTTGLLANLLGFAADAEVGVLEVECRSRGDQRCRFLFGGAGALGAVYSSLLHGADVDQSLAQLA
jgi:predicted hydrocarbon binding protein